MEDRSAFISIIGSPNVGKSSILNKILGQKVSIVSPKPQTTRTRITGVFTEKDVQLVFLDTPGIHKPFTHLGEYMMKITKNSILDVDVCAFVIEAGKEIGKSETKILKTLLDNNNNFKVPTILIINKIDLIKDKKNLITQMDKLQQAFNFEAIVPVSAKNGDGIEILISEFKKFADFSPHFFDDDSITDQPERTIAAEIIREKLLRLLDKEVPHGIAVFVERMKEREEQPIIDIDATIFCEKTTHKGIIIGKNGSMLKKVGSYARENLESFFNCKVNLQIWVKVKEDWRNRDNILKSLGFDASIK